MFNYVIITIPPLQQNTHRIIIMLYLPQGTPGQHFSSVSSNTRAIVVRKLGRVLSHHKNILLIHSQFPQTPRLWWEARVL